MLTLGTLALIALGTIAVAFVAVKTESFMNGVTLAIVLLAIIAWNAGLL